MFYSVYDETWNKSSETNPNETNQSSRKLPVHGGVQLFMRGSAERGAVPQMAID